MAAVKTALQKPKTQMDFDARIKSRTALIAVVGLGYVGLPLAVAHAQRGFRVLGVDVDRTKIAAVNEGRSYVTDVPPAEVADAVRVGRLFASTTYTPIKDADVIICVPTPCTRNKQPDTSSIEAAAAGSRGSCGPASWSSCAARAIRGRRRSWCCRSSQGGGLDSGEDVYLAFVPERVDPGARTTPMHNTPVVVGGADAESTAARRASSAAGPSSVERCRHPPRRKWRSCWRTCFATSTSR